ncbi:hypothetical protein [Halorubrum sp. BOL3-1]|uniref:hypothetical protein n=1 Tax=Halorubrum sp. BOL3-1 TaxID=2497325 RepID=UPI001409BE55|nr:hypothetical protein [Halorubrum sp. BOL3-1]
MTELAARSVMPLPELGVGGEIDTENTTPPADRVVSIFTGDTKAGCGAIGLKTRFRRG